MNDNNERSQYLTFYITGEEYAIPILRVREIIEYSRLTRVPSTPPYIRGVINLRGSVVPVVDLGVKFGFEGSSITRTSCIVVVELTSGGEQTIMGVIADSVRQVVDFAADDIQETPAFGVHAHVDFLLGMGLVDGQFVLLLDIDKVLSTTEILAAIEARNEVNEPAAAIDPTQPDAVPIQSRGPSTHARED